MWFGNSFAKDLDDNPSYHDVSCRSSRKDSPFTSLCGQDNDSEYHSSIVTHNFGLFYPILSSIKSFRIAAFQSGLTSKVFRNPSDISIWFEAFYAQALLVNMHEYFSGQVCFHLHHACDAMFHLKRSSSTSPFNMKIVVEYVNFWNTLSSNHPAYRFIVHTKLSCMLLKHI